MTRGRFREILHVRTVFYHNLPRSRVPDPRQVRRRATSQIWLAPGQGVHDKDWSRWSSIAHLDRGVDSAYRPTASYRPDPAEGGRSPGVVGRHRRSESVSSSSSAARRARTGSYDLYDFVTIERTSKGSCSALDPVDDGQAEELGTLPTPGIKKQSVPRRGPIPSRRSRAANVKTLVYMISDEPVLVLLRGDHDLQEHEASRRHGSPRTRHAPPRPKRSGICSVRTGKSWGCGGDRDERSPTGRWSDVRTWSPVPTRTIGTTAAWTSAVTSRSTRGPISAQCPMVTGVWSTVARSISGRESKWGTSSAATMYSEAFGVYVQDEAGVSHP